MIKRYCEGRFVPRYITTIGVDYGVKKMTIKNRKVAVSVFKSKCNKFKVNFFDLSGDDDYETIRNEFYKDSQVFTLFVIHLNVIGCSNGI